MIDLHDEDIEVIASSALRFGRGGQQVAPRPGVVAIHRPTGIAAISEDDRSQHGNRVAAIAKLRAVLEIIDAAGAVMREPDRMLPMARLAGAVDAIRAAKAAS